jgi:hypothetical protein
MEGLETAEAVAKSQRSLIVALPAAFFIACGQPNQERSSLPVLTVLPLLTGKHQQESEWVEKTRVQTSGSGRHPEVFFCPLRWQYVFALLRFRVMDLLKACDEMKGFIETAQKLVDTWDADPDNYSQLEEGLSALKAELEKFKD